MFLQFIFIVKINRAPMAEYRFVVVGDMLVQVSGVVVGRGAL